MKRFGSSPAGAGAPGPAGEALGPAPLSRAALERFEDGDR